MAFTDPRDWGALIAEFRAINPRKLFWNALLWGAVRAGALATVIMLAIFTVRGALDFIAETHAPGESAAKRITEWIKTQEFRTWAVAWLAVACVCLWIHVALVVGEDHTKNEQRLGGIETATKTAIKAAEDRNALFTPHPSVLETLDRIQAMGVRTPHTNFNYNGYAMLDMVATSPGLSYGGFVRRTQPPPDAFVSEEQMAKYRSERVFGPSSQQFEFHRLMDFFVEIKLVNSEERDGERCYYARGEGLEFWAWGQWRV